MKSYSLMIARFPGQNQEHPASAGYIMGLQETLLLDARVAKIYPWRLSDTPITMSRNRCVQDAMKLGVDYLLMIDADMSPDHEPDGKPFWNTAWDFLMDRRTCEGVPPEKKWYHADEAFNLMNQGVWMTCGSLTWRNYKDSSGEMYGEHFEGGPYPGCVRSNDAFRYSDLAPRTSQWVKTFDDPAAGVVLEPATVAAPYCGPPPHECVYVFRWAGKSSGDPEPIFRLEMVDRDDAAKLTGVEEVAALPTGLILYDVRVFHKLPPPWFDYEWADEPYRTQKASTEDVFQTRNASLMGMPQFCAWDCWAGHVKTKTVGKPQPMTVPIIRAAMAKAIVRSHPSIV